MTRIDYSDGCDMHCFRSDHAQMSVVNHLREAAHAKHGQNSVESGQVDDYRMLAILVEEVGEVAQVLNEIQLGNLSSEKGQERLARELYDSMVVCSAWIDKLRSDGQPVPHRMSNGGIAFKKRTGAR